MSDSLEGTMQPVLPIPSVWLLHGKGGSPAGTVNKIEAALELHWPGLEFLRPMLPHHDPVVRAEDSVDFLMRQSIPSNALLLGVSLGGLVAARMQESCLPVLGTGISGSIHP